MAQDSPCDFAVFQLRCTDLPSVCAVRLVEDVLRCDLNARTQMLAGEEEVEGRRRDDDLCVRHGSAV